MLIQHTLDTLRRLKLTGMAQAYARQLEQAACSELSFDERLGLLVDHEGTSRDNRRLTRLLQLARFKQNACALPRGHPTSTTGNRVDWTAPRSPVS